PGHADGVARTPAGPGRTERHGPADPADPPSRHRYQYAARLLLLSPDRRFHRARLDRPAELCGDRAIRTAADRRPDLAWRQRQGRAGRYHRGIPGLVLYLAA